MAIFETFNFNLDQKTHAQEKIAYETASPFFLLEHIYLGHCVFHMKLSIQGSSMKIRVG